MISYMRPKQVQPLQAGMESGNYGNEGGTLHSSKHHDWSLIISGFSVIPWSLKAGS